MNSSLVDAVQKFREIAVKYNSESLDFNLCNGYIVQSTRASIESCFDEENIVILTRKGDIPVITTWTGKQPITLIGRLVSNFPGKRIVIKNVDEKIKGSLSILGFKDYGEYDSWDAASKYDDNSYPELVLNTEKLVSLEGSEFQSLREDLNRFNREYNISVEEFSNFDFSLIQELFTTWISSMSDRNGWAERQLVDSTKVLFTNQYGIKNYIIKDELNGRVIGWMNFSECSKKCLGFNVLVNDFEYYNLYRIMILKACGIAQELGYEYLNIQGSEDEGQYISKLRMKPEVQLKKVHMVHGI